MPGFRPGKVPAGLVRKMYGKSILVEEINKCLNENIHKFITENNLEVLGNPLPKPELEHNIDWDNQKEFEFVYDLGLAPQFELAITPKDIVPYYTIKVDEATIDKHVEESAKRYGKVIPQEVVAAQDMLFGDFVEVDSNNEIIPGGIFRSSSLFLERYIGNNEANKLIGLSKGEKTIVDVNALTNDNAAKAALLGIEPIVAEQLTNKFQFTIKTISRIEPAELNTELFDKIHGVDQVKTTEEFRARIKQEMERVYTEECEKRFFADAINFLKNKIKFNLPDHFLKRWLVVANEKPVTFEQVEAEYDRYADGLKWQLIENKLIRSNEITVTNEEAENHVRNLIAQHYQRYNAVEIDEAQINETVTRLLNDEKESKRIFDQLYSEKLIQLFKSQFGLENKEVSLDEFSSN